MIVDDNISYLQHALYETSSGERLLDYFLQESAYLKTYLSQLIDGPVNTRDIVTAEYFQTLLIQNDTHMNAVRKDAMHLKKLLLDCLAGKNHFHQRFAELQKQLVKDIARFEIHFPGLKNGFNAFAERVVKRNR